jgi:hypothetical protein
MPDSTSRPNHDTFLENQLAHAFYHEFVFNRLPSRPTVPVLYHYTSADGLRGIVGDGAIRLTNSAYVNDQGELNYPMELAREVIHDFRKSALDERFDPVLNQLENHLKPFVDFRRWFVASLSTNGDLLSQWRAYCRNGGYSIGLRGSVLLAAATNAECELGEVLYDRGSQIRIIRAGLDDSLLYWQGALEAHADLNRDDFALQIGLSLVAAFTHAFTLFKSPAFSEECEWRLVSDETRRPRTFQFVERRGLLTPFVSIRITDGDLLPIERIFISPIGDLDLARHAAALLLKQSGYANATELVRLPSYRLRF